MTERLKGTESGLLQGVRKQTLECCVHRRKNPAQEASVSKKWVPGGQARGSPSLLLSLPGVTGHVSQLPLQLSVTV